MRLLIFLGLFFFGYIFMSIAQEKRPTIGQDMEDESALYAQTKQINQFFRRFNGEENEKGDRFFEGEKQFRSDALRKKYLPILFDENHKGISSAQKKEFLTSVTDNKNPQFVSFHQEGWFAEVSASFRYQGKVENAVLFLKIQPERLGYEWVIEAVDFPPLRKLFVKDTSEFKKFLHPMSHELGFMNFRKAFSENTKPEDFTPHDFRPDQLTLFLYEMKKGLIKFESVRDLKFHFFQVDGWYFEISEFNRPGYNTGWLISNLVKINATEAEQLKKYIYGQE